MLRSVNPLGGKPPTGEPDAGNPPVRFGGRGERDHSNLPTPISFGAIVHCNDSDATLPDSSTRGRRAVAGTQTSHNTSVLERLTAEELAEHLRVECGF